MQQLVEKSLVVHNILDRYIQVHDDIFKFSLRKVIPIPGLFKPIDYKLHYESLYCLKEELEGFIINLDDSNDFAAILKQYAQALMDTILFLREICGKLYEKSKDDLGLYSKQQYQNNIAAYQSLVQRYRALGLELNRYFKKV